MKSCSTKSRRPKPTSTRRCSASNPRLFCEIAEWDGEPVGFAVWFVNFSTFSGRSGIYLEDLFVRPALRGKGIGKALLVHLAKECVANGWSRLQWSVLDWNTPSIEFYKSLGAEMMDEWTVCRVGGPALTALAQRRRGDGNRPHRRGRRERRDRRRRRHAVAAEIRHGSASRR